jgi:hypothetical protein
MKPQTRDSKDFLIDIDKVQCQLLKQEIIIILLAKGIGFDNYVKTPNGWHLTTRPFNPKIMNSVKQYIEIKNDALLFIKEINN